MSRLPQMWHPDLHPRWPAGAPASKGGEFRDKRGGGALPIAGGGSVATGKVGSCGSCGRSVKVVGNGKLSTHNVSKGKRCPGSGAVSDGAPGTGRQVRARTKTKAPTNKDIQPTRWPRVQPGRYDQAVQDPVAWDRMKGWFDDAARPGRQAEDQRPYRENALPRAQQVVASLKKKLNRDPEDWDNQFRLEQWQDWLDGLEGRLQPGQRARHPGTGTTYTQADLDAIDTRAVVHYATVQEPDLARPLAVYGDMLRFDDSWLSYMALQSLEERIPSQYHAAVAQYLAETDGGIWLSGRSVLPDMDSLGHLRGVQPRGWHQGATWADVDGVVSDSKKMAVSYTANTERHLQSRSIIRLVRSPSSAFRGNPHGSQDTWVDASAALHEFGHLADHALGGRTSKGVWESASEQRGWRLIYNEVAREGGRGLNPYYRQRKLDRNGRPTKALDVESSAQELWADAFSEWAATDPVPVLRPDGSGPHMVPIYRSSDPYAASSGERLLTWRVKLIASTYDIPYSTAFKIDDYFEQHAKQVRTGKRKPFSYNPRRQ